MCGKAGAGKTTLAARLAVEHGAILLSEDIWIARLFGDRMKTFDDYRTYSARLRTVVGPLVSDLLRARMNVVMDFPANTRLARAWLRSLFDAADAAHVLHFIDTPDLTCLQRIDKRNAERPEGSYVLSPDDFAHISSFFEAPGAGEQFHVELHGP